MPADALDAVKIAREWVNKAMAVSHPMTCAGITSRGPVQANGMCKHFLNAAKCDCPPENSAEARIAAFESAVRSAERARLRGLVEGRSSLDAPCITREHCVPDPCGYCVPCITNKIRKAERTDILTLLDGAPK